MKLPSPMILGQTTRSTPLPDACHLRYIQRGVRVEDPPDDYRATSNMEAPQQHHKDEGAS